MGNCMKSKEKKVEPIEEIQVDQNLVEIHEQSEELSDHESIAFSDQQTIDEIIAIVDPKQRNEAIRARIEYLRARILELEEIIRQLDIIIAKLKQLLQELLDDLQKKQKEEELKKLLGEKQNLKKEKKQNLKKCEKFEQIINNRPGTAPQQIQENANNKISQKENVVNTNKNGSSQIVRSQNPKGSQSSIFQSQMYRKKLSRQFTQFEVQSIQIIKKFYEFQIYNKNGHEIYWTNQHQNHLDDGVDIGFKIERSQIYQQFAEINPENSEISIKLFYLFAKEFFKSKSKLYLCFRRGGSKGKLQFARNLFYVTAFDMFENNLNVQDANQGAIKCLDYAGFYNAQYSDFLDQFTNCYIQHFVKVDIFEKVQDRDTIYIILNMMKIHKKSINQPTIINLEHDEKVDEIKKQYHRMKLELSKF